MAVMDSLSNGATCFQDDNRLFVQEFACLFSTKHEYANPSLEDHQIPTLVL